MDTDERLRSAIEAATDAGEAAGYVHARPVVLRDTNNVVVWLAPHPVVAKVGTWPNRRLLLERESDLCAELATMGSPVATPLRERPLHSEHGLRPGAGRFGAAELPVSLWRQLDARGGPPTAAQAAAVLLHLHADLERCDLSRLGEPLPSYLVGVDLAIDVLGDDDRAWALDPADLRLLRSAMSRWRVAAAELSAPQRPLHGEPRADNVLSTSRGLVIIDFEAACVGPVEWDLASVAPEVDDRYVELAAADHGGVEVDRARLDSLRALNSARVATWCFAAATPEMRAVGEAHLATVRAEVALGR